MAAQTPYSPEQLIPFFSRLSVTGRIWVAFSGGMDSHVLLHSMVKIKGSLQDVELAAIHIHHGLQQVADDWVVHCQSVCDGLEVPLTIKYIAVSDHHSEGLEAAARRVRYQVFGEILTDNDLLLLGHHQDDQAETLMLQLLRGSGVRGLAAMPSHGIKGELSIARPLLGYSREQLLAYAKREGLHWVEDHSNDSLDFDRNYLRHRIMPLLKARWPQADKTLARTAQHSAHASVLLEEMAQQDLNQVTMDQESILDLNRLCQFSSDRIVSILRFWLRTLKLPMPSTKVLSHIVQDVLRASADANPCVTWSGGQVRRYRNRLYGMTPMQHHPSTMVIEWDLHEPLRIPHLNIQIVAETVLGDGLSAKLVDSNPLSIRFRQGGERLCLSGKKQHQNLKKLFQERGIPPWERSRLPLIWLGDQLAAVLSIGYCDFAMAKDNEQGYRLRLVPLLPNQ